MKCIEYEHIGMRTPIYQMVTRLKKVLSKRLVECSKACHFPRSRKCKIWVVLAVVCFLGATQSMRAQNRGVYPLGMSATSSGITPDPGFTYANQFLYYSRDQSKDENGNTHPVSGQQYVAMDMNSFTWVSEHKLFWGARYSATATLPFAKNDLTEDVGGKISGGAGFADSYYVPLSLGWNRERISARVMYGFLAPTGRFAAGANDNVGSGYWTQTVSSGQTFFLTKNRLLAFSAFQMYEFHTKQKYTGIRPGDTFDLDYSLMASVPRMNGRLQFGLVGYEQRQTTAKVPPTTTDERYAINAVGFGLTGTLPKQKLNLGVKYFKEFANRASFQGYSLQFVGAFHF
jgi:hypothetical protein